MVEMALNIKNEEAHRLARELARLQGVSLTEAVIKALQDAVKEFERQRFIEKRLRASRKLRKSTAALFKDDSDDPTAFLYDENGLPK